MLVDLHVHVPPRGADIEALLAKAPSLGLDGLAIVADGAFAKPGDVRERGGVRLFVGAEVATDRGHYLVFVPNPASLPPFDELFGPRTNGVWPVRDVLARTLALGGAVVAAHPYDAQVEHPGGDILFTLPHLAAVEAVNPRHPPSFSFAAVDAAETLGLPCVGGSGARTLEELGKAATLFTVDLADEAALVDALRSGACWPVEFGQPSKDLLRRSSQPAPRDGERERAPSGPPRGDGGDQRRRRRRR